MKRPNLQIEKQLCEHFSITKASYALAIDEAGRGPLFGPVTVGAFVITETTLEELQELSQKHIILDSKRLSPQSRKKTYEILKEKKWILTRHVAVWYIDRYNINQAIYRGVISLVQRAILRFHKPPTFILMDGNYRFSVEYPFIGQVKGDETCLTIAAASIAAKVERDNLLIQNSKKYGLYQLEKNKGYPTKYHRFALLTYGPTKYHRKSYLRNLMG